MMRGTSQGANADKKLAGHKRGQGEGSIYQRDDGRWAATLKAKAQINVRATTGRNTVYSSGVRLTGVLSPAELFRRVGGARFASEAARSSLKIGA